MPAAGGKNPMKGGMALSFEDREWGEAKDSNPAHSTACSAISGLFVEVSKECPSDVRSRGGERWTVGDVEGWWGSRSLQLLNQTLAGRLDLELGFGGEISADQRNQRQTTPNHFPTAMARERTACQTEPAEAFAYFHAAISRTMVLPNSMHK